MQFISKDKRRKDTVQDKKELNLQCLTTQAKKGEQLVSMMPPIKKAFDPMDDDIVDLSTKKDALKNKKGSYDENWLKKSDGKLLKQTDDEKKTNFIMFRMKKQMNK